MRILIADDDATYRQFLTELLGGWSFEVLAAADGREALRLAEGLDEPIPIILDWNMPEIDGFEVARTLRARERTHDAYILLITGSRRKEEVMRVLVSGADDYLMKPFDAMDLKIHLRTGLRMLHLQQELAELRDRTPVGAQGEHD